MNLKLNLTALRLRMPKHLYALQNRLVRAPYFRGHSVHSPYIYSIVREVFMVRELQGEDHRLYEALLKKGISERRAVQLQNLARHCGYQSFGLDQNEGDWMLLSEDFPRQRVVELVAEARQRHRTVALLNPYASQERLALCKQIIEQHDCTTVDNRAYLLIFNNHLPKQHFKI